MKNFARSIAVMVVAFALFIIEMAMWPLEYLKDRLQEIYDEL